MPVQPAALELLTDLSRVLARWGRWYVFVPEEPERFVRDMQAAGFALRVDDPDLSQSDLVSGFESILGRASGRS